MNKAYLLLGGNMGNPETQLALAEEKIRERIGQVSSGSSLYRTAAWGDTEQPDFVNKAILLETGKDAGEIMKSILEIEESMGRKRTVKNAPRIIDIDILLFNEEIHNDPSLQIPHPFLKERRFALEPLNEIAGDAVDPREGKTVAQLLQECPDPLPVKKI